MIKLKQVTVSIQMLAIVTIVTIATIAVLTISVSPVGAEGNQSNQDINRPALLIAPDPDFQINVYPKPGTDKRRVGYGLGGDTVTVMEQVSSNQGYTWNYVRFEKSPQLEGWIREDFVEMQENVGEAFQSKNRPTTFPATQTNSWRDRQIDQYSNQYSDQYRGERQNSDQQTRYSYQENQRKSNYSQRQN